jgi:CTP-dependent riboflavin kinase
MHDWKALVWGSNLKGGERAVMVALASWAGASGTVSVTVDAVAHRAGMCRRSAQKKLGQLVDRGFITRWSVVAGPAVYTLQAEALAERNDA